MASDYKKLKDWPDIAEDFQELLDSAEAGAKSEWEENFISDMLAKYAKWGQEMFLSENQKENIERIAANDKAY